MNATTLLTEKKLKSLVQRKRKADRSMSVMGDMLLDLELQCMTPEQRAQFDQAIGANR